MAPLLLVDGDTLRIIKADGRRLLGGCLRCGTCCRKDETIKVPCEHLAVENVDGKPRWFCNFGGTTAGYFDRPARCALWPQPQDPRPKGCGFRYEGE